MKKIHSCVYVKPEAAEDEEDMEVKMKSDKHIGKSWVLIGIVYNFLSSSQDLITTIIWYLVGLVLSSYYTQTLIYRNSI